MDGFRDFPDAFAVALQLKRKPDVNSAPRTAQLHAFGLGPGYSGVDKHAFELGNCAEERKDLLVNGS
jgi:hypothetical protein